MKNNGQTFIKGALILALANFIVKIIGAIFKIPLYELIGKDGSGLFNVAYQIYTFMFIIATAGFPTAVSKMVAESTARGDEKGARKVFETASILLGSIGIIGATLLFVFADDLAVFLGNSDAAFCIKVIAPTIFFTSIVSAFRGYFQGRQNMYPTAASEVIEALSKLVVGIVLAMFFMNMAVDKDLGVMVDFGAKTVRSVLDRTILSASGAIFGVSIGAAMSLVLMVIVYGVYVKKEKTLKVLEIGERTRRNILKELVLIAIPITIGAAVSSLTSLVDLATVMNRLVVNPDVFQKYDFLFAKGTEFYNQAVELSWSGAEILEKKANTLYGMYTGQAQTMFNLPLTIIVALSMSAVPAISSAIAGKSDGEAKTITKSLIKITVLFALPCAVGLSALSKGILGLLYSDADAFMLLEKLSIAIIFVSIVQVSNAVLQAYGKVYYPVFSMLAGGVAKVLMNYFFIPVWGIDGAPIATIVCYGIIALINIICIVRVVKIRFDWMDTAIKPLFAALVMGFVLIFLENAIGISRGATILTIGIGGLVYVISAFLVRAIKREDILILPKGEKLAEILEKFRLIK
ncbi:MAG: polysaccharide biosynthesis C-terminal domain-containing protein [Clostridia bacterium]|nr:polysaccharide biosynthesis C-terminal domain-containing protein [Clostridia bacterium]